MGKISMQPSLSRS